MAVQGEVFEATARLRFSNTEDVQNSYQFQLTSAPAITDEQAIEDIVEIIDDIYVIIQSILSVLMVAQDIVIRRLSPPTVFGAYPFSSFVAGTATADPWPPGSAGLVTFGTSVPHVILKKFYGVFTETVLGTAGNLTTIGRGYLDDIAAYLMLPLFPGNGVWIYGYQSPKTASFVIPTVATTTNIVAYQRRRKPGVGS